MLWLSWRLAPSSWLLGCSLAPGGAIELDFGAFIKFIETPLWYWALNAPEACIKRWWYRFYEDSGGAIFISTKAILMDNKVRPCPPSGESYICRVFGLFRVKVQVVQRPLLKISRLIKLGRFGKLLRIVFNGENSQDWSRRHSGTWFSDQTKPHAGNVPRYECL